MPLRKVFEYIYINEKKRRIKVSVLIANYNNQKFVVESISSIKKQNFKNLEIIVIDDRSTDGSYKVLKKIKNIDLIQTKKKKNILVTIK